MTLAYPPRVRLTWCALALLCSSAVVAVALGAEPASGLPLKTKGSLDLWHTAVKAIALAVLCLAGVAAVLYALRHRLRLQAGQGPAAAGSGANVEWARRASPRTTLLVVRWQGRCYLLAENSATTQVIDSHLAEESRP